MDGNLGRLTSDEPASADRLFDKHADDRRLLAQHSFHQCGDPVAKTGHLFSGERGADGRDANKGHVNFLLKMRRSTGCLPSPWGLPIEKKNAYFLSYASEK